MNASPVFGYSLPVHATAIRSGLYDTVRESPHISADFGQGMSNFSAGHFLPFNRPDYRHEYSPYYGLSGQATLIKFIRYWARSLQNLT
jgi:hypothetical protein